MSEHTTVSLDVVPKENVAASAIGRRPILNGDSFTPQFFAQYELLGKNYIAEDPDATEKDAVVRIGRAILSPTVRAWFEADQTRLESLSWSKFVDELRAFFLPPNWAQTLETEIFQSRPPSGKAAEWANKMHGLNQMRPATSRTRLDDLRLILHSRLPQRLREEVDRTLPELSPDSTRSATEEEIKALISSSVTIDHSQLRFVQWVATVTKAEHSIAVDAKLRQDDIKAEVARMMAKLNLGRSSSSPKSAGSSTPRQAPKPSSGSRPPKLTEAERTLLKAHQGCLKCRKFYAGHFTSACPYDFPSPSNVPRINEETAARAKRRHERSNPASQEAAPAQPAAARQDSSDSETDSDASHLYVPSDRPHLYPNLLAAASSKAGSLSHRVQPLIDTGCPTVMISPRLADQLALVRRPLKRKEKWGGFQREGRTEVSEYCKLRLFSGDRVWVSRVIYAKVVPGLFTPMILGLSGLARNHIVIDAEDRSAIVKGSGYDLMKSAYASADSSTPEISSPPKSKSKKRRERQSRIKVNVPTPKSAVHNKVHNLADPSPALVHSTAALVVEFLKDQEKSRHRVLSLVKTRIEELEGKERLDALHAESMARYKDRFPHDIPMPKPAPDTECHRIRLRKADAEIRGRKYSCPQKYQAAWRALLEDHVKAGRLRPAVHPEYISPAFVKPKADKKSLRFLCDYRGLNALTIKDRTPLPRIDEILNDCARGRYFAKIDMTNAFYQTRMHPDDIKYTAVDTPFGVYEWTVMPMGLCNAPATQQRRMTKALYHLIGRICHVYLDDIIIWSDSIEEHRRNIKAVMTALRAADMYCSEKKTQLWLTEVPFLGHVIRHDSIQSDPAKTSAIRNWPRPQTAKQVRAFLGLVRYIANFLPHLAEHTAILTPLTRKECNEAFPEWTDAHQQAFDAIKAMASDPAGLAAIQADSPGNIYVTTDASDIGTGALLSIGPDWKTARPVAFDSMQFNSAQKNYAVHEKELLAIIRALTKFRYHLLGTHFTVYTDHRTLQYFQSQPKLSRRQARWAEILADYDFDIEYVKGADNEAADALSRFSDQEPADAEIGLEDDSVVIRAVGALSRVRVRRHKRRVAPALRLTLAGKLLRQIKEGYERDEFCQKLKANLTSMQGNQAREENGLLYRGNCLIIPQVPEVREALFHLAHDSLGHFGTDKAYEALRESYYWPKMRKELMSAYIPGCADCQRNKSSTSKPTGPLHPLPIPDARFESVAIDRVGPLPEEDGFNGILTMTDRLGAADVRLVPCRMDMTAKECAKLLFDHWYCENGLPLEIVSDRDTLFTSEVWKAFSQRLGIKLKMSTAYHPQTDGASERTNKTLNQLLRYVVDRRQTGWVKALPRIRFAIMNTVNASTGHTPFFLRMGHSPRVIPTLEETPSISHAEPPEMVAQAKDLIESLNLAVKEAQDALFEHKTRQAHHANARRSPEDPYKVGDLVMLSTENRRREYKAGHPERTAKLMPRSDGPFEITSAFPDRSYYNLRLPGGTQIFTGFHASQLKRFIPNDDVLFPGRALERPGPVAGQGVDEEWELDAIVDRRGSVRRGWSYLVRYKGWGNQDQQWISRSVLRRTAEELVDEYEATHPLPSQ